jgi:hypothetical protein
MPFMALLILHERGRNVVKLTADSAVSIEPTRTGGTSLNESAESALSLTATRARAKRGVAGAKASNKIQGKGGDATADSAVATLKPHAHGRYISE